MINKKKRLTEKEVKKVLQKRKPFFAYGIVLNHCVNRVWFNRFAIVIWWKSVNTNVTRVFFRRRFYDYIVTSSLWSTEQKKSEKPIKWTDFVFVVKKQTQLDRKEIATLKTFKKDLNFLIKKVK